MWFNLPGLYYVYNDEDVDFVNIIEKFVADKDASIRMQIAKWLHEIVTINSKGKGDSLPLKNIFFDLLTDDDPKIQWVIMMNLEEYVKGFFKYDEREATPHSQDSVGSDDEREQAKLDFYSECIDYIASIGERIEVRNPNVPRPKITKGSLPQFPSSYREKQIFYEKIILTFEYFQPESIKIAFYDAAMHDFLNGPETLRKVWALLLAKIMYSEYFEEERIEMLESLIEQLSEGDYTKRRSLLDFIESSIQVFSKKYWKKYLYKIFWRFAQDPIPLLRIRFAKSWARIWTNFTRQDTDIVFIDEVDQLLDDVHDDVREAATYLDQVIIKGYDASQESRLEEEEKSRLNFEFALKEREKREKDEIQRKKDEEKEKKDYMNKLTDQMRMKKRYLKLPGFQAKLFTKKATNGKGRGSKRGSFTMGNRSKTSKNDLTKKTVTSTNSADKLNSTSTTVGQGRSLSIKSKDRK